MRIVLPELQSPASFRVSRKVLAAAMSLMSCG